jgi:hypothetical protein
MIDYEMEYCWWDILCMPQDKQDEINLEIPLMGDYYSGAEMTLVLSDMNYIKSDEFVKWYNMMTDVIYTERNLTPDEHSWINLKNRDLVEFHKDQWFNRVWTFQETVLSEQVILIGVGGNYIAFNDFINKLMHLNAESALLVNRLFKSSVFLINIGDEMLEHRKGITDLVGTLDGSIRRDCYKMQDKFYGILGILGYKDFVVDYGLDMDTLNKLVAQHAYSKGDLSWMAVAGNIGPGFVQPMYENLVYIGTHWKKTAMSFGSGNKFGIQTTAILKVDRCERFIGQLDRDKCILWAIRMFMNWGFDHTDIIICMMEYTANIAEICAGKYFLENISKDASVVDMIITKEILDARGFTMEDYHKVTVDFNTFSYGYREMTIIKAKSTTSHRFYPMKVYGDVDVGDIIVMVEVCDHFKKNLGIVISESGKRKGVCYISRKLMHKEGTGQCILREFVM